MMLASPSKGCLEMFLKCFRANRIDGNAFVAFKEMWDELTMHNQGYISMSGCCADVGKNYVYVSEYPPESSVAGGWTSREVSSWPERIFYDSIDKEWMVHIPNPVLQKVTGEEDENMIKSNSIYDGLYDDKIILQFASQIQARDFKMLCLGFAAANHGQLTGRQFLNLIDRVNSSDWHANPGIWIALTQTCNMHEIDTTGWTDLHLTTHMVPVKIEADEGPKMWQIELDSPKELPSNESEDPSSYYSNRFGEPSEVVDIIDKFCAPLQGRAAFDNGNAIKYILRWHHKNGVEDLKKAIWCIQDLIKQVESEENKDETATDN